MINKISRGVIMKNQNLFIVFFIIIFSLNIYIVYLVIWKKHNELVPVSIFLALIMLIIVVKSKRK